MYEPPYSKEEIKKYYPNKAESLLNDPVHLWRAETGIELIHREPDINEQNRIWENWKQMSEFQKEASDQKSLDLFGLTNEEHHNLLNLMCDIKYGYVNKNEQKVIEISDLVFYDDYKLQSPEELIKSKIGVCWDQCELERYYFENKINKPFKIYYVEAQNKNKMTHTLLVYKYNNKYYWFENSWFQYRGIHKFETKEDLFNSVSKKHIKHCNEENKNEKTTEINWFILKKPKYNIGCIEFMNHARSGELVYNFID